MEIADEIIDAVICGKVLLKRTTWDISFMCNFCEKSLSTLPFLLQHVLNEHVEKNTTETLKDVCEDRSAQEGDVEPDDCDKIIQEIFERQEQEEMDEQILQHFMNQVSKDNNKCNESQKQSVEGDVDDPANNQSNAKFEFFDIADEDNFKVAPVAVLPKRVCKISTMLECGTCNAKFHHVTTLREHKKKEHGEKAFVCKECGNSFDLKTVLVNHEMRHKGIKPYACSMCEKTFTTRTEVRFHMRRHTGERPHQCRYCEKAFVTSGALTTHEIVHTNERPHLCPICGKSFRSSCILRKHLTCHSTERPHKCSHCSASFKNRCGLRQHLHIHAKFKKYSCQLCGKSFAQLAGVHSHLKTAHKKEKTGKPLTSSMDSIDQI